ncbi:MAG: type II secretion system protein [Nitrospirota bacterium]
MQHNFVFRHPGNTNSRPGVESQGFTLLEVLLAIAVLGIAVTVVLQLFSANLRTIGASGEYVTAAMRAEMKMREILDEDTLAEGAYTETTYDGYRMDMSVSEVLAERTESLPVRLLEIYLTVHWVQGGKERSLTLKTLKMGKREV